MEKTKSLIHYFNPESVAVIGASRDTHKLGHGVVRNLHQYHYRGKIYPVNPRVRDVLGYPCYPSILSIPEPVDLAVIVVPAHRVVESVEQCGQANVKAVIVVSGGFSEIGGEGTKREAELKRVAHKYNVRLMGPNCIGTIDTHTPVNTTFVTGMPRIGDIAFVSQSGAVVAAVIDWARGAGVGFSRMVSLGNGADVNEIELLTTMADDPQTAVVTGYIEGVADGRKFLEAATEAARKKPMVMLKVGRGEGGARAVASHTGALAGSAEAYDAAFRKAGVLRADSLEELFDWARGLAWQPLPKGNRVAVLTNAGGPGILAVDALEAAGMTLAPLTEQTREYLRTRCPEHASVRNPVDILAGSGPGTYARALDALLADETVDAVIVIQAPQDWFVPTSLAEVVGEVASGRSKPVLACIMGLASTADALSILHRRRVPNYAFPERVASTIAAMVRRRQFLDTPVEPLPSPFPIESQSIETIFSDVKNGKRNTSELVACYGIQVPPERLATSADEAAGFAAGMGFPVALKVFSPDISHKTDVGGVKVSLQDEDAASEGYAAIMQSVRSARPDAEIFGVTVQGMVTGGQEVIIGWKRDPQFGPVILVGSGGTEVELLRDVTVGIAPLTRGEVERMIDQTLVSSRLRGWRNRPPGDRDALVEAILRLSQMSLDLPDIVELEINPLQVLPEGKGAVAVDCRAIFAKE